MAFNSHHACLWSCMGLGVGAWLFAHLLIPSFHLALDFFSSTLCTRLGLPHPSTFKLINYICGQPLNLGRTHLLHHSHGGEQIASHDIIQNVFISITINLGFHVLHEQIHVLYQPPFSFLSNKLTLCYQLMASTPWPMLSLPTPPKHIWIWMMFHFKEWPWWWQFEQEKDFTTIALQQTHFFPLP